MSVPRFSLVIPARNEEAYLPRLLDTVDEARRRYEGGPEAVEVIVSDNASTDGTAAIARERGCRLTRIEKRVIAAVRNGGARIARGEVLAFIDADGRMHPGTFNAIDEALATGRIVGGATGVEMERLSVGIALTYALFVPMVWLTGMDTGVVFCRRDHFEAIGGYDEDLKFAEDVRFLWDLRRLGRSRRLKLARLRRVKAIASTRKFDRFGDWHYLSGLARAGLWFVFSPRAGHEYAQKYWYDDER